MHIFEIEVKVHNPFKIIRDISQSNSVANSLQLLTLLNAWLASTSN